MKYITGVLIILVAVGIIAGLGAMTDGIKDFRTDRVTNSFILTTNTTTVNGTVQLSSTLWEALPSEASISSNLTSDSPSLTTYVNANKSLNFNGLATNTTRLITVQYRTAGLADYPGADKASTFIPMAVVLGALFLPLLAIVMILLGR